VPGLGGKSKISIKSGEPLRRGDCDVAVQVMSASLRRGTARFVLEPIGVPRVEPGSARECGRPPRQHELVVSGLERAASLEQLEAEVDRVLQTPERFLADRGVTLDVGPADPRGPVADKSPHAGMAAHELARKVKQPLRRVLSVAPVRRDSRKAVRYYGEVSFDAVAGANGRLRDVRVAGEFADHADRIEKALELWRYDPARTPDGPVASRVSERTTFRIF